MPGHVTDQPGEGSARDPSGAPDVAVARPRRSALGAALDALERIGNALPNPATLFLLMALLVVIASAVAARLGVSVIHPKDGSTITAVDLLARDGIRRMFTDAVKNFVGFAPLGTVLVAMIGIGVAEATGLIAVLMRAFVMAVPRGLLTAAVVFAGVMANQAADAGIILLPPLGALLFAAAGRHPLAGIAAAFAGVSGGFSANLLPSTLDVLLAGFTQEAVDASKLLPGYRVQMLGNLWFMMAATPLLTVLGTWITHRLVEPRLGPWGQPGAGRLDSLTPAERRGLRAAGIATLLTTLGFSALVMPGFGPLRAEGATLLDRLKPFFDSLVTLILLAFFVPGLAFGLATGKIRNDHDVMRMTSDTVASMAGYIVLAFCAAQFVSYFAWSNLGRRRSAARGSSKGWGSPGGPCWRGSCSSPPRSTCSSPRPRPSGPSWPRCSCPCSRCWASRRRGRRRCSAWGIPPPTSSPRSCPTCRSCWRRPSATTPRPAPGP